MRGVMAAGVTATIATGLVAHDTHAQLIGGADETTENFLNTAAWGAASAATPGTVSGAVSGTHLLISEIGIRSVNTATVNDSTKFIESYNPTTGTSDLSTIALSDVNA